MFPRKLKNLNLFNDGVSYLGEVAEVTLPTLSRKLEEYRGGGMDGPVKVDMGQNAIDLEWKCGGLVAQVLRQYGLERLDGAQLRFAGAYQSDDTGGVDSVEVVVRGRHEEVGFGTGKSGEDTEFGVKTACAYYKLTINGEVIVEIDFLNMVFRVNGVDRLADQRAAIGV